MGGAARSVGGLLDLKQPFGYQSRRLLVLPQGTRVNMDPLFEHCVSVLSGMIRLPKATKAPLKSKLVPRQSLAIIVKDLGERRELGSALPSTDCPLHVVFCSPSLPVLQPSRPRSDSRPPADLQHPSTGTRPASREWARVSWAREALTASVVAPHSHRGATHAHTCTCLNAAFGPLVVTSSLVRLFPGRVPSVVMTSPLAPLTGNWGMWWWELTA